MQLLLDEGLVRFVPAFLPGSRDLFERLLVSIPWDERIRARRVASFGVPYNYSGMEWPESTMPDEVRIVAERVSEAVGCPVNNCLANHYPDNGSTMGWHSDSVAELGVGTGISIISLGATRTISFRRETDRGTILEQPLPCGSLLHMTARMQADWRHAILKSSLAEGGRISLTFRSIRALSNDPSAG